MICFDKVNFSNGTNIILVSADVQLMCNVLFKIIIITI